MTPPNNADLNPTETPFIRRSFHLFLISLLSLFLELVLIRLLASEIRVFAYFKNFPLFAAFIGLGLGCYVASRRPIRWWLTVACLSILSLAAILSTQLHLNDLFFPDPSLYTWRGSILSPHLAQQLEHYPVLGLLVGNVPKPLLLALVGSASFSVIAVLFVVASLTFYPIGQEIGRLFSTFEPLRAYSINIGGALCGSALFTLVAYFEAGPLVWLLPCFAMLAYFTWLRAGRRTFAACVVALPLIALVFFATRDEEERLVWSPYYRIGVSRDQGQGYALRVNHDYFQRAVDLRPEVIRSSDTLQGVATNYDLPFKIAPQTGRVLVVGAGMGNDAAAALRARARHVTAVEIDPAIVRLGKELHPERPYDTAQVVVDDARAYFRRNAAAGDGEKFDLVVFGLLDSHTALSSMSSVRLEFYVYTIESLQEALSLVDPDHGVATISFSVGWRDWVGQRLYESLSRAAGGPVLVLATSGYDGGITFVAGPGLDAIDAASLSAAGAVDVTSTYAGSSVAPATDDWPFLYVNPHHLPWVYLLALALLVGVGSSLVSRMMRLTAPTTVSGAGLRFNTHMFLMGAAFMLLETSAIARMSLLLGGTWLVTASVIFAVMVMILGANTLASAGGAPRIVVSYALLGTALCAIYVTPFDAFLAWQGGLVIASLVVCLPVLFASLVFAETFKNVSSGHIALGCNMLGAIVGGALEAASLGIGIRALALLALLVYGLSALALWNTTRKQVAQRVQA